MRIGCYLLAAVVVIGFCGCKEKESSSVREKELEIELTKAKAAQAQAEADRAKALGGANAKPAEDDAEAVARAEAAARQAVKDAAEAKEKLDKLMKELEAFDTQVNSAVDAVANAQNDADRKAATERLKQLQMEQAGLKARVAEAQAAAAKAERMKGTHISKECMDNPLAKGCM